MKVRGVVEQNVTRGSGLLEGFLARQRMIMAEKLIPPVHRSGRLLDIGCGSYPLFLINTEFSEKYGLEKLIDTDYNEKWNGQNLNLLNYNVEKEQTIPFQKNYFDTITMLAVFEHIDPEQLNQVMKEIHRILKPGGIFIMTTPAFWTDGLLRVMAKTGLVSPAEIDEHKDTYSHLKIARILQSAKFSGEKLRFGYFEVFMNIWATATK